MTDLPGPLRHTTKFPFVGRSAELRRLQALMPRADTDGPRVVLLGGEPGSGKTRLVSEFAAAASDDVLVLSGTCDAEVRTPYGPFVEGLDQLVQSLGVDELRGALGRRGGELARLLPDLGERVGALTPAMDADPDTERHRLHMAVGELLDAITRRRPTLFVIEDLHWADTASLLLLRHLARTGEGRVLFLATFRDTEVAVPEALSETIADLRRYDTVRIGLEGLSGEEVADFVQGAIGAASAPEVHGLAETIRDLTDGNAFLVCELWRALVETDAVTIGDGTVRLTGSVADLGSPDSVREVVSQRLSRLAPATNDLLELAAAAGAEFALDVVARAAGLDEVEVLAALDEAVRSGMIETLPSRGLACRFAHELVRRALYDRLSGPRRAELHLRVGEALEASEEPTGRVLAGLAHHFATAAPFGDRQRAVDYNVRAARSATAALAFDQAAALLRTALELGVATPLDRLDVHLELGNVCHRSGKALEAQQAFMAAADIAREIGEPHGLARAAIGYENACWRPGIADQGAVELLEEAAAKLGDEDSTLRVGLLGGLARALAFRGERLRAATTRAAAVRSARHLDDRRGLAGALVSAYWSRGVTPLPQILDMLTEARDLGTELGDTEILAEAMSWRVPAYVALCDHASARTEIAALLEVAEQTAQPFIVHVAEHYGSAIALCDGSLGEAEARARRSHEWSRLLTGRDASGVHGIQMFSVLREQGRLAELAPAVSILARDENRQASWRPGLAALLAEVGMEQQARDELERLARDGLDAFRESLWMASLAYLTDAAAALGDEDVAALVYPELVVHAGENVMVGHLVSCYGAADRYLGMLATTLGEWDRAQEHFERGLTLNRSLGAATWVAHTSYEYARLELARPGGDRSHARALLGETVELAERIGLRGLLARARALGPAPPATGLPAGLSPREVQILVLVAQGHTNRRIGSELSISQHTAANHVRSILRKTGCANRTEAATYAHRHGLMTT